MTQGGGEIRFYESKGGNSVKIYVCKYTASMGGLGACPLGNFCILDSLRLLLVHSQVHRYLTQVRMTLLLLMHSQVETLKFKGAGVAQGG